jgi:hypothetical protein
MTPILQVPGKPGSRFFVPVLVGAVLVAGALRAQHEVASIAATAVPHPNPVAEIGSPRLAKLPLADPHEAHSVDVATAGSTTVVLAHGISAIATRRGTPVSIAGWAVDRGAHLPSSYVVARIARRTYVARVNIFRQDVAVALASAAYAASGFELDIDTTSLPLGRSRVELYGIDASGKHRYDLHRSLTLTLTQS